MQSSGQRKNLFHTMTIQPPGNRPREISVTEAIEPAYDRMKLILFQPFDFTKWIVIGFCAWLALLGEFRGGGGFNGGNYSFNNNNHQSTEQFRHVFQEVRDYVLANLDWIIPAASALLIGLLAVWALLLWINSHGKFMLLHCVALNTAEIEAPWIKYAGAANSLFWFQLAVRFIGLLLTLPLAVLIVVDIVQMVLKGEADLARVMSAIGLGLACFGISLVFLLIRKFLVDFVVPIMYLRGSRCLAAWREFFGLLSAHFWQFVVYVLFQIVLKIAIGIIVLMAILVTCCILGCFLMLPFIGTVLLLPILIFKRAYPLYYLAQFGPEFDVFPKPPTAPARRSRVRRWDRSKELYWSRMQFCANAFGAPNSEPAASVFIFIWINEAPHEPYRWWDETPHPGPLPIGGPVPDRRRGEGEPLTACSDSDAIRT